MNKAILWSLILVTIVSCSERRKDSVIIIETSQSMSSDKVKLGKDSEFYSPEIKVKRIVYTIPQSHSDYYQLSLGDFSTPIFLAPGDRIYLSSDFKNSEYKSYSGKGALLNNYILRDNYFTGEINKNTDFDSIYSLPPLEFINSIDSIYELRNERLEKFISSEKITDELFISTENKRIFYESSIEKNHYYRDHTFLTGQKPKLNEVFNSYLKQVDFDDSDILHLEAYRSFLYTYFESIGLQQKDIINENKLFTELAFENALNRINNPITKTYTLYRIMDVHLSETPINELGKLIDDFNNNCLNKKYKEKINNYYSRLEKLKFGMPAPNFSFPDKSGKKVFLSDFKGKLVYIDIWNSNCSPCFKEFPALEELIENHNDQDIVFIGISYDSNETVWKKTMKKKKLKGVQLFASGWNSQFGKDYLVYSNPRFILIDNNGNFINAKAPRPSEHIDEIIKQHIK